MREAVVGGRTDDENPSAERIKSETDTADNAGEGLPTKHVLAGRARGRNEESR